MLITNNSARLLGFQGSAISLIPGETKPVSDELAKLLVDDRVFNYFVGTGEIKIEIETASPAQLKEEFSDPPQTQMQPMAADEATDVQQMKRPRGRPRKIKEDLPDGSGNDSASTEII